MTTRSRQQLISGWGQCPRQLCQIAEPTSVEALQEWVARRGTNSLIARGLGRADGDSSLNELGIVISKTRLNRFLAFDSATGLLQCEAGW